MGERIQTHRQFAIGTSLGDDVLLFRRATIVEQLGRPFQVEVECLSEDPDLTFKDIVGHNATIRAEFGEEKTRYFNGFVTRFTHAGSSERLALYKMTLSPWLWFLTRVADCRIFQNKNALDIIKEVFRDRGFSDFSDELLQNKDKIKERVYCVQYRETDFNFVSRLMEEEGMYYFFEHENGKHKLILANDYASHGPKEGYATIPYFPPTEQQRGKEYISDWLVEQEIQPGKYAQMDYDFVNPKQAMHALATFQRDHAQPNFEYFDFPGGYTVQGDGEAISKTRLEEFQAQHEVVRGRTDARNFCVGATFTLENFPRESQNAEYLITTATTLLYSDEYDSSDFTDESKSYDCEFTCILAKQPYRPKRITPKPTVLGCQTAFVVGPDGEEIHTDEHGRVKVKFHWDRYGTADDNASCWIRVSQIWAGKKWGAIYTPRVGQEVIVDFLEGDPDQPIIVGRVYNGDSKPPYPLPDEKTKSTIKSLSSKGGGGFNEFRFEDKKGKEQVFLHAEKNLDIRVKSNEYETVGWDRHLKVMNKKYEYVKKDRHEIVDMDHKEKIGCTYSLAVGGSIAISTGDSYSLKTTADKIEAIGGSHYHEVSGDYILSAANVVIDAGQISLVVGGNHVVLSSGGITIKAAATVWIEGALVNINSGSGPGPGGGSCVAPVEPAAPEEACAAASADPGENAKIEAEQHEREKAETDSVKVKDYEKPPGSEPPPPVKTFLEFQVLDAADKPVSGEKAKIKFPDGTEQDKSTDGNGVIRLDNIDPGSYQIRLIDRFDHEWAKLRVEDPGGGGGGGGAGGNGAPTPPSGS